MNKKLSTLKQKSHVFGKDVYLLGENKQGEKLWLEAAKWSCDGYWGFGYIETYTNNNHPGQARDITSHSHWSGLVGKQEYYDTEKNCFRLGSDYIHHLNDNPDMAFTVLTDAESWELTDLMQTFYTLRKTAALFRYGNSYLTSTSVDLIDRDIENHINNDLMPRIFARVYEILTPES